MSEIISKTKNFKHFDNIYLKYNPQKVDASYEPKSNTCDFVTKFTIHAWLPVINYDEIATRIILNSKIEQISKFKINSFDKIAKHINEEIVKGKSAILNEDGEIEETNVSEFVWDSVRTFLISYLRWISSKHGISIDLPEITPLPDGSVDLMWYNSKGKLLINIGQDSKAYYYSDFHNKKNPMKGNVGIIGGLVDESLALRLKNIS
jgi:hypothetical protein